jgi:hypothetical protein
MYMFYNDVVHVFVEEYMGNPNVAHTAQLLRINSEAVARRHVVSVV